MTLLATSNPQTTDAVRLLSAVGDTFGGRSIGFGLRVANVAARFAVYCECDPDEIDASFYGAALHQIGAVRIVVPRGAEPRFAEISSWDDPPAGAAMVAASGIFPPATADAIRWHREAFDGTGFPDQLRWNSIPRMAMAINISRAFVTALEEQGEYGTPADALYALVSESGCIYSLAAMKEFREFLVAEAETFDAPYEPAWPLSSADPRALIVAVCTEIDSRQPRTTGRGDRLERIVRRIVGRLDGVCVDPDTTAFVGRLTALARTSDDGGADDIFTLTRLGLDARAARAGLSARILASAPSYAPFARTVGSIEEWFDGSGSPNGLAGDAIDPMARVLAVAIAVDSLTAGDASRRIAAAAGTRLDPRVVAAYRPGDGLP